MILKGGRNTENNAFQLNKAQIKPSKAVRYLGIVLGSHCTFADHVNMITKKAEERISSLCRLMPNIGGPQSQKRTVLSGVMQSCYLAVWSFYLVWNNEYQEIQGENGEGTKKNAP